MQASEDPRELRCPCVDGESLRSRGCRVLRVGLSRCLEVTCGYSHWFLFCFVFTH